MKEQQRWTLFIFLAMVILLLSFMREAQRQHEIQEKARVEAEAKQAVDAAVALLADDSATTASIEIAGVEATLRKPTPAELPQVDLVALWHDAERLEVRNERVAVQFSAYGGRIESWKVIDPVYSVEYKHALNEKLIDPAAPDFDPVAYGDELVMEYPHDALQVPRRPLELSVVANGRNYRRLNQIEWELADETDATGGHVVTMTSPEVDGLRVVKQLHLPADSYRAFVTVRIENKGTSNLRLDNNGLGLGLTAWGAGLGEYGLFKDYYDFSQVLFYTNKVEIVSDEDIPATRPVAAVDWVALGRKYTLAGILRPDGVNFTAVRATLPEGFTKVKKDTLPLIAEVFVEPETLAPGGKAAYEFELFAAPKARKALQELSVDPSGKNDRHLGRAIFHDSWFNWFRALCLGMMWLLDLFHSWTGSWGVAILLLTVTMKLITHPVNHRALRINAQFQREMAKIKPELDELKARLKDEPMKMHSAQTELMKKHNISPFAPLRGCLPMLLQLPVFVALYQIIGKSVALRGESFLWVVDLSESDRLVQHVIGNFDFNLLPLLMVATQIVSMKLSSKSAATDPNQKMMMYIMPVVMLFLLYNLASGLFLYWVSTNLWQIGHTLITNREVETEEHAKEVAPIVAATSGSRQPAGPAAAKTPLNRKKR